MGGHAGSRPGLSHRLSCAAAFSAAPANGKSPGACCRPDDLSGIARILRRPLRTLLADGGS